MGFRFREWQIYKDARKFRSEILKEIIPKIPKEERYELVSQLKRALNSVILNIAEGAYRKSDKDFAHFLNQSITSLYEVIACLELAFDNGYINENELNKFSNKAEALAKQLSAFSRHLRSQS